MSQNQKVVVIGCGPVGSLAALYAARRGYPTELYDLRDDPNHGDSTLRPDIAVIPLGLSERGIRAIEGANVPGLLDDILSDDRPTYTRMVHIQDAKGKLTEMRMSYGPHGQCLHTIQREKVSNCCLLALEKEPTAKLMFNHKMIDLDFDRKTITFELVAWKNKSLNMQRESTSDNVDRNARPAETPAAGSQDPSTPSAEGLRFKTVKFDFLIGADGTYSAVRQHLMRKVDIDFSQVYAKAIWCDLILAADESGNYRMDPSSIHIWPADENIVVAQADIDGSFRAGVVCQADLVRKYESRPEDFAEFFSTQFPGIIPELISAEDATAQFVAHQKISLRSVKMNRFGYRDDVLLLGDSSHTMTPFHAMGMITGLEDVRIFFENFRDPVRAPGTRKNGQDIDNFCPEGAVAAYTADRVRDVSAMVDLAHEHYHELRHGIRSPFARARKICDGILSRWVPFLGWTSLYARIQFGHERFSVVRRKEARQRNIVNVLVISGMAASLYAAAIGSRSLMALIQK
ncbi:kynurenine 3-monooxygenase [Xylaria grammica]|nr:kynurenine 3-monooxygenase [Xylaria grammica]